MATEESIQLVQKECGYLAGPFFTVEADKRKDERLEKLRVERRNLQRKIVFRSASWKYKKLMKERDEFLKHTAALAVLTQHDVNKEKAIVLYKPDAHLPEVNENTISEDNSIVQLLKVLEARKSVLQKEQGMAFARAVAAGFEIDYTPALMSFAECFGASRLMGASAKFRDLWKRKHEMDNGLKLKLLK
ncbi:hypothetical protein KIW84_042627 [Lathyrus oleraceus]|uniref:Uncharacterized protein n=1 Tax=Pisum sativum TaxID=3888 RepID=A0A9D4XCZ9_PEA|nr:hypothetical protein KIW84_042627 [Pisum sativum]